ncbi:MAG: hypothetical protein U1A28_01090 [Patescibacteria group bacterium]|nr:hypothetical protein [Patescibacteria group bacterium]
MSSFTLLEQSILTTLVYFDCLDRALTAVEVWRYLTAVRGVGTAREELDGAVNSEQAAVRQAYSFADVLTALEIGSPLRRSFIAEKNGYLFLNGREQLYEERIERLKISDQWWKKMRRIAKWFSLVPYVRLVMASGSLGMQHMTPGSDLDVLVVLRHGRIWTGRFLLTILMQLLGVRRHGRAVAGRICLNHYITDRSLHIPFHSLYNAVTYAQLVPVMAISKIENQKHKEGSNLFLKFEQANSWVRDYLPNRQPGGASLYTHVPPRLFTAWACFGEWWLDSLWGDAVEWALGRWQLRRITRRKETYAPGGRVRADDVMLAFHPDSPEQRVIDRFNRKMIELGLAEFGNEKDSGLVD